MAALRRNYRQHSGWNEWQHSPEYAVGNKQPRVISNPSDVANFVLMQVDAINTKKDELTIAIKGLADFSKQLDFRTDAVFSEAGAR